ncbi:thioesterase family protein [Tamaricihabitans halophyticus]|nr:thioesterase family protein [Tamaricihabitans halophyticus]
MTPDGPADQSAFFEPRGDDWFAATPHTAGPWSVGHQHLGPPSALLARALEHCPADREMQLSRITIEILGPVPVAPLHVRAQIARPGKSVEQLTASLESERGVVATASAWRMLSGDTTAQLAGAVEPLTPSAEFGQQLPRPAGWLGGYLDAMEWRSIDGALDVPGPAKIWLRQRVPLVTGEQPSGLQRLLAVADSGNGASSRLKPTEWYFINTELTVHIQREPTGEWIGLDANTIIGPNGVGTAVSVLHDHHGQVANGAQSLLIRPR